MTAQDHSAGVRAQVAQSKAPNEQTLATLATTAQQRANAIINDDDVVLGSCASGLGSNFGTTSQGSTTASGSCKGKGKGGGPRGKVKDGPVRLSKSTCPVTAAINARRLSLKTYNNVVSLLARAVESAQNTIAQAGRLGSVPFLSTLYGSTLGCSIPLFCYSSHFLLILS